MTSQLPIAPRLVAWQRRHGRHHLPWQGTSDPYRVWLSEIMLQQTQVATVLPYYQRFIARFPDVATLAAASEDTLMPYWAGLGYYTRARNLLACAKAIMSAHGGRFPDSVEQLADLPGIGRSTAGAIASLAMGRVAPILDGNVRRVFARYFGIHGHTALPAVQRQMWAIAEAELPDAPDIRPFNQGLMDLGAMVCKRTKPLCFECPLQSDCVAHEKGWTALLPSPKPAPARREEHFEVLLHVRQQALWLEKRPDSGVWAGLWMAPMRAIPPGERTTAPDLIHELTHRRYCLYGVPQSERPDWAMQADGRWQPLPLADDAPVPACLHKLLGLAEARNQPV